jgi:hypothetical protein
MKNKRIGMSAVYDQMKRPLVALCLSSLLLALLGTGCKHEANGVSETNSRAGATINPTGTYTLVSVDGHNVPCKLQHQGHAMTIGSGSFVITADGTCSSRMSLAGGDQAIERKAAYSLEGPKLKMNWQGAGTTVGAIKGDTFTMNNEGMVFAYRKEN